MEVRDLRYFVAVAEEGNFTRAAERLFVAQPAVSHRIMELERQLGRRLFDRTSRRVELTAAGRYLLTIVRPLVDQFDEITDQMTTAGEDVTEDLTVATLKALPGVQLPLLIHSFRRSHPTVRFVVREMTSTAMLEQLAAGTIDLAIAQAPDRQHAGLVYEELARDDFVLIVPLRHRLATHTTVVMSELDSEDFITLDAGSGVQRTLRAAARRAGFTPRIMIEVLQLDTVRELVAAGLGIALIPRSTAEARGPAVEVLAVGPPKLARPIVVVTPETGITPGAQAFRDIVLEAFARSRQRERPAGSP